MDTYVDTTIPYPDAKVAAALCVGGPIMYEFVQNCGLDDCWVNENAVPNIMKNHGCKRTAAVFGRAVLWACFDPLTKDHVPQDISDRVTVQYERIRTLEPSINPVKKVGLVVAGHEGQLFIDRLPDPEAEPASNDGDAAITDMNQRRRRQSAELQAVFSQLACIRKQNEVLQTELGLTRSSMLNRMKIMTDTLNRIASMPHQMRSNINLNVTDYNPSNPSSPPLHPMFTSTGNRQVRITKATLSRNPKTLYILWHEYDFEVGERRPAKSFSRKDRGDNRHVYSKRNVLWSLVVQMVGRGHSANGAIDKIYQAYGFKTSVTEVIKKLIQDKKTHYMQFL